MAILLADFHEYNHSRKMYGMNGLGFSFFVCWRTKLPCLRKLKVRDLLQIYRRCSAVPSSSVLGKRRFQRRLRNKDDTCQSRAAAMTGGRGRLGLYLR